MLSIKTLLSLCLLGSVLCGPAAAPTGRSCADTTVYGIRGSGQPAGLGNQVAFVAAAAANTSTAFMENKYPAIPPHLGEPAYTASVDEGVKNTLTDLQHITKRCAQTTIVVVGFSQGAQVAHTTAEKMSTKNKSFTANIAAIVLLSDPTRRKHQPGVAYRDLGGPAAFDGRRTQYAKLEGELDSAPEIDKSLSVISVCHYLDPVCSFDTRDPMSSILRADWHTQPYVDDETMDDVLELIAQKLAQ